MEEVGGGCEVEEAVMEKAGWEYSWAVWEWVMEVFARRVEILWC